MKKFFALFLFLAGLALLLTLGGWQVQRLQWKNDIIAKLEVEYAKDPATNILSFESLLSGQDFHYGSVTGRMIGAPIYLGPKTRDEDIGFHLIAPLRVSGGVVFVNFGWVQGNDPADLSIALPKGNKQVTVHGVARQPDWNRFSGRNSPVNQIWVRPDLTELGAYYQINDFAPVMLYAELIQPEIENLFVHESKPYPRNKHQQYALFWFGLAFLWCVIMGLAVRTFRY